MDSSSLYCRPSSSSFPLKKQGKCFIIYSFHQDSKNNLNILGYDIGNIFHIDVSINCTFSLKFVHYLTDKIFLYSYIHLVAKLYK